MTPTKQPILRTTDQRARLLASLWQELRRALQRVSRNDSRSVIHEVRVGARRMRAVLRCLQSEMNPLAYAQLRFDLKNISRELADVRMADMHARLVGGYLSEAGAALNQRSDIERLLDRTTISTRESLAQRLREESWQRRLERMDAQICSDDLFLKGCKTLERECRSLLSASIDEALHSLRKRKDKVPGLHKLRVRIKRFRYVCEALTPMIDVDARRQVAALSHAQSVLGEVHDWSTVASWLKIAPVVRSTQKALLDAAHSEITENSKRFHRSQPELRRSLKKLAKAVQA